MLPDPPLFPLRYEKNDSSSRKEKESLLTYLLTNLDTTFTSKINKDLLEELKLYLKEKQIPQQRWFAELILDYLESHKARKSVVNMDTYLENPDFIAVPDLHCSKEEKIAYIHNASDDELVRIKWALTDWNTVFQKESRL